MKLSAEEKMMYKVMKNPVKAPGTFTCHTVFAHQAGAYSYFHFHVKNTNMVAETSVVTK